jgi:hypothetical protein
MPSGIHGVSWLFIQACRYTGPVFGLSIDNFRLSYRQVNIMSS